MLNKERPEVIEALVEYTTNPMYGIVDIIEELSLRIKRESVGEVQKALKIWLNSEYVEPFKVTQAEKCILELLRKKGYVEIKRDRQGSLWVSDNAGLSTIYVFNDFFRFVKKCERLKIKDILENCEVIDDAK